MPWRDGKRWGRTGGNKQGRKKGRIVRERGNLQSVRCGTWRTLLTRTITGRGQTGFSNWKTMGTHLAGSIYEALVNLSQFRQKVSQPFSSRTRGIRVHNRFQSSEYPMVARRSR